MKMVDEHLIMRAQLLTTGADVHKINGLIQMYQSAAEETSLQSRNACVHFEQALKEHLLAVHRRSRRSLMPDSH